MRRHCSCTWLGIIIRSDEKAGLRLGGGSRSSSDRSSASFSARAGHARLRIAVARRVDHSRAVAHLQSFRNYRASKSTDQPLAHYRREPLQSYGHTLPARGVAAAQITSRISSSRFRLFFSKRSATVGGRDTRERVAVCETSARSTELVALPGIARQSRNYPDYFS